LRIPKKKELIELQKKYRTDKRIGEIYGVPPRLVTYWRSKKKIGPYSFPKYSEDKIRELWGRFGDDGRAGEELNISKAGFKQWRRKYRIDGKPFQLRLEQLELPLPDAIRRKASRRETIAQKILAKKSGLKKVETGEVITIEPDLAISQDNIGQIYKQFAQFGLDKVWDPNKMVVVLDPRSKYVNGNGLPSRKNIRDFINKQKVKHYYDFSQGLSHQLVLENALVSPGQLILSTDNQATCYGSLGAFSTGISASEMAAIWATGKIWLKVPETIKIVVNGRLSRGIYAKDIVLRLARALATIGAEYKSLEFYGTVISSLSVSERFTLTCLSDDINPKAAIVPFDDIVGRFLRRVVKTRFLPVSADLDAVYFHELELDISSLTPLAGSLNGSGGVQPIEELDSKKVEQVVLGCCSSGRIEDLEIAARMLRGRHINQDTRMTIIPASHRVLSEALERGYIRTFVDSGCMILSPGCGSCIDVHNGYLEPGERAVTTACCGRARNAACGGSEIYQVSPATAAASALEGAIADPRRHVR
jgi:3-isopropylmalate/(R)-2-methylmalate dehydratase large subunit